MISERVLMTYRKIRAIYYWHQFKKRGQTWVNMVVKKRDLYETYSREIDYLKANGAEYFPYDWAKKKQILSIQGGGLRGNSDNKPYVLHGGKKLYVDIMAYSQLLLEQNPASPHRYFTDTFRVEEGDVFVDVGAAEGMISLEVIEKAKKIYLIECEEHWLEHLKNTFAPYKEKIVFVTKYASDKDDEKNVSLDSLLKDETSPIFLKLDVEGMEDVVLRGAQEIVKRENTKVAICTYHRSEDAEKFKGFFENLGYMTEFSQGYMAMVNAPIEATVFRKTLLRAWKKYKK